MQIQKISKWFRLLILFIFLVSILYVVYRFKDEIALVGIIIAFVIGISGIFQNEIRNLIFKPIIIPSIKVSTTKTTRNTPVKYYNLNIKNDGFSSAKNIRAKIKSGKDKEWLSLLRPFFGILKELYINKLSPQEEENFNIGCIYQNQDTFQITSNIQANNQKLVLNNREIHTYFLEIVSDNAKPISIKMVINNKGFDFNDLISIK